MAFEPLDSSKSCRRRRLDLPATTDSPPHSMDYTLAQYQQPAFDQLAFDGAKRKLLNKGYPELVLDFRYDHLFWTRGLIMDTSRGNFLKIDRHKYVRVAYHGFSKMSSATRKVLYRRTFNKVLSFSGM
jgi:5' nucleotidase family